MQYGQNDLSGKAEMTDTDRCKLPGNDIEDSNTENNDTEYHSFYSDSSEMKRKRQSVVPISRLLKRILAMPIL